jgi:hypothetical protein
MTIEGRNRLVAIDLVVKPILLGTLTRAAYGSSANVTRDARAPSRLVLA